MTGPLVSVVIPVYDGAAFIAQTLDSVLRQSWPRLEVIVVDDGSTDETPERVRPFRDRILYLRQENRGGGAARNAGVAASRGDYLAFLDQDDLWAPEKLERQLAVARAHPESGVIACDGVHSPETTSWARHCSSDGSRGCSAARPTASGPGTPTRRCCAATRSRHPARRSSRAPSSRRPDRWSRAGASRTTTTTGCASR